MTVHGDDTMTLTYAELHMLCRVAAGEFGWSNNHPDYQFGRDSLFTHDGQFVRTDWGSDLDDMLSKNLIAVCGRWVLVTDKGRDELVKALNIKAALDLYANKTSAPAGR